MRSTSALLSVGLCLFSATALAQQSNISVTPPPLAEPTFSMGDTALKLQGAYLSMSGDQTDFNGFGAQASLRHAFSDLVAGDLQGGVLRISGSAGGLRQPADMTLTLLSGGANLELQPVHGETLSLLIFAGANVNVFTGSVEIERETFSPSGFIFGPQGGAQLGVLVGGFHLDPFVTFSKLYGTVSAGPVISTSDVGGLTVMTYGLDITYVPLALSLSSFLQVASQQDDDAPYKTIMIQVGRTFRFGQGGS